MFTLSFIISDLIAPRMFFANNRNDTIETISNIESQLSDTMADVVTSTISDMVMPSRRPGSHETIDTFLQIDKLNETVYTTEVSAISDTNKEMENSMNALGTIADRPKWAEQLIEKTPRHEGENCTKVLPEAIIPGVMKGGTGTLAIFLAKHPDIAMQMKIPTVMFFNVHWSKGLGWYRNQMACSSKGQITMEKSPQYFSSAVVPRRVHAINRNMKLLFIVREPIKRAISHYLQVLHGHPNRYKMPFEKTITTNNGGIDRGHTIIKSSLYFVEFKHWLQFFSIDDIHIVNGDNFKINPWEELNKIEKFLGISRYFAPDLFTFNADKKFYCLKVSQPSTNGCMSSGKGRPPLEFNSNLTDQLKSFFKPYNEDFFRIIGQRFDWGY